MAVTTWSTLKTEPVSRKVMVIKTVPREIVNAIWTYDGEFANGTETLDDCEATTGWAASGDASAETLDSSNFKEGSNSLNMGKSGATQTLFAYFHNLGATYNGTGDELRVWLYIQDKGELLQDGTGIEIRVGDNSTADIFTHYYSIFPDLTTLQDVDNDGSDGWNNIGGDLASVWTQVGSPDITVLDRIYIRFNAVTAATTITHGNFKMDYWRLLDDPVNRYSVSFTTYHGSDISGVEKDGTAMSRASALTDLNTFPVDNFFYDIDNTTLYINTDIDNTIYDAIYSVLHLLYFSSDSTFRTAITTSTATIIPDPRIDKLPKIVHSNKGTMFGLNLPAKASFTLNNLDGALDSMYLNYEWSDADVTVYLGGESLAWSEYQIIYAGRISDKMGSSAVKWRRNDLMIKIEDRRTRAFGPNPMTTFALLATDVDANWIGMPHEWRGKSAPQLYGKRVDRVPILGQNIGYTLRDAINSSQTTLQLVAPVDPISVVTTIPNDGEIVIDNEKITYTTVDANGLMTISARGVDSTEATAHSAGALITVIAMNGFGAMQFNHFNGFVTTGEDLGALYLDDKVIPKNNAGAVVYKIVDGQDDVEDGTILTADALKSLGGGNAYGSMLQAILNDLGIVNADLDTASFTALDSLVPNSIPGVFFNWNDKGEDIIDLVLQSCKSWLVIDSGGLIEVRQFNPVVDASALIDLTSSDIESWAPRWDLSRMRTNIKVLYGRKYALSGDKEWRTVEGANRFDGIIPVEEKELQLETADYNETYAEDLRDHLMAVTLFKQERIKLSVLPLRFAEVRPGDRIRINLDRPWGSVDKIYEIEEVSIEMKKGGIDIELDCHNVHGLSDRVGALTDDSAAAWSSATADEKIEYCYLADDNDFIDPTDATTKDRKVLY